VLRLQRTWRSVMNKPIATTAEMLTPIWERVLQRSPIQMEDNFFDLGGDSLLSVQLFSEIERACGRELAPVTIYCAPTIASLAAILEEPTAPRFPPVLQLKAGNEAPPVFLAHGLGGTAMDFYQLVKYMQTDRSIYGLQAKGADGVDEPFDRIEDLAQFHLDAIKELQPHGPYYLIGFSLGGLVTLEIAQRLKAQGEEVALLALLESYPHSRYLSFKERARLGVRLTTRRASTVGRLPFKDAVSYILRPSESGFYASRNANGNPNITQPGAPFAPGLQRARDCGYAALARYRPSFYNGAIKFVRAGVITNFPEDPAAAWSGLTAKIEVATVPGDHVGILAAHYETLASVVSRFIRETSSQR
jgi:thioesterase domain-containing protein/acyl carrier protein